MTKQKPTVARDNSADGGERQNRNQQWPEINRPVVAMNFFNVATSYFITFIDCMVDAMNGIETEKGQSYAGKEDNDIEIKNNGDYFDDDGNDNEYEPINEEHDDRLDYNSIENDNTTGSIQENTATVLGGRYCLRYNNSAK